MRPGRFERPTQALGEPRSIHTELRALKKKTIQKRGLLFLLTIFF